MSRLLHSIIEQNRDREGLIWPESIAPFDVYLIPQYPSNKEILRMLIQIEERMESEGMKVLVDDRTNAKVNSKIKKKSYFKFGGYNQKHFYSSGAESLILMDKFKQCKLKIVFDDNVIVFHNYPGFIGELKRYNKFGRASIHIEYERPDLFRKEFSPWALWKNLLTQRFGRISFLEYLYQITKLISFTVGYSIGKKHYLKEIKEDKIISPYVKNY